MTLISVRNLTKSYRIAKKSPGLVGTIKHLVARKTIVIEAVKSLDFQIEQGEIVGFIGPNGAGKTTTLKMLCGLIHPTGGDVLVGGFEPRLRDTEFLHKIALIMGQKQQLIWDLPPIDTLKVNAAVYGLSNSEANRRIKELGDMLQLEEELTRPVRKLSLGERMKAELLASLLHRPSILFLDEPTLGLDLNAQIRVREFLINYNKIYGATILLSSHYMSDITSLCSRVLVIDKGTIYYDGSLEDLTRRLSPYRGVKIKFSKPYLKNEFTGFGQVIEYSEYFAQILIKRSELTSKLYQLLKSFSVIDLEVSDPPIEELIGEFYQEIKTS